MLLDFGFLTEQGSWKQRILKIWCHDKKNKKFKLIKNLKASTNFYQISYETLLSTSAFEYEISAQKLGICTS